MARMFLALYVIVGIIIIIVNVISNLISGDKIHLLDKDDWIIFIIACSSLAICEAISELNTERND